MKYPPYILLAYPKVDHEKDYVYYWMPFSVLVIAGALIKAGHDNVEIFDGNLEPMRAWRNRLARLAGEPLLIGFSIMTGGGQIRHALEMAAVARELCPRALLAYGGPHVNVLANQTLEHPLVDAVLPGPGQNSVPSLVEALQGKRAWTQIPGLLLKREDKVLAGPLNPPKTEVLGRYPWRLIPVAQYIRNDPTVGSKTLNYVSSQGCVYKCRFCYELTYLRKYSAIPADPLLEDVQELQESFGINGIKFYDADFFINRKRVLAFCRGLRERSLNLAWAASINPNDIIKGEQQYDTFLEQIAASGCTRLLMGMESGSDRVLGDIVEKEVTRADLLEVAKKIASHGILGSYTFIVGFPGESAQEIEETYALVDDLRVLTPQPETRIHLFAPYPGTPLYSRALEYGFVPPKTLEQWSRYDYYDSQTPWTSAETVQRARSQTRMRLVPSAITKS